ncbi:MAG: endonuclease MutS2, partial [Cytophagales bacterium]|nr:endonuclease MutS2 [Cytophagales bacterium]
MIYPENLEVRLGFDNIREKLNKGCLSNLGQFYVEKLKFSTDFKLIDRLTTQTAEFKQILESPNPWPSQNYFDVYESLKKSRIEGLYLSVKELANIKSSLDTIIQCMVYLEGTEEGEYTSIKELINFSTNRNLVRLLDKAIDDNGTLKDTASKELQKIRYSIISESSVLRKTMDSVLKHAKAEGFTPKDANPTLRNGRMVIPVRAENKRAIKGLIHDESATGQTSYIEPASVFDINNRIKELEYEENREVIRILTELTTEIRYNVDDLQNAYVFLGKVDFIRSKAKLAIELEGIKPRIKNETVIDWKRAFHPLLVLNTQDKNVIPLNLSLDQQQRILLISGPNAGGKSVTLKTVGLLQYMIQCGLLVPMEEHSVMGVFKNILVDIGDQQSLENELSTYSAHLYNMTQFLKHANKQTLFLIDEFGTGTEPDYGGSIAESILLDLNNKKPFGVITTHYANLKEFSEKTQGVVNGAMLYDLKNLSPLYELEIGKPGSSFAFEIAQKIGLSKHIIDYASKKVGNKKVNYDKELKKLEAESAKVHQKVRALEKKEKELNQLTKDYQELKETLDNRKKEIVNKAKAEAKQLINDSNKKVEGLIREIRESNADKEKTRALREDVQSFGDKIKVEHTPKKLEQGVKVVKGEIAVGDEVKIDSQDAIAKVISIKGNQVEVMVGELRIHVKKSRLQKLHIAPSY